MHKLFRRAMSTICIATFIFMLSACTVLDIKPKTDRERYALAESTFLGLVMTANDLYNADMISEDVYEKLRPTVITIASAMDGWNLALMEENKTKISHFSGIALSLINKLEKELSNVKHTTGDPISYRGGEHRINNFKQLQRNRFPCGSGGTGHNGRGAFATAIQAAGGC